MSMKLVIVESPSKSKTIEKYLGKDYKVVSSLGHIRDLSTSGKYGFGIDLENHYKPDYVIIKGKKKLVNELKKEVKSADCVYLATDPDREGEAISWHLYDTLGLNDNMYRRIVFNEITKNVILDSFQHARMIDDNLVKSQETRRMLDRIIGFRLSKLMQSKTGGKSAGRVQSVALKLIVDREREILAFVPEDYYEIEAVFADFKAKLDSYKEDKLEIKTEEEAIAILNKLTSKFIIENIKKEDKARKAKPPYITSTLQQEASSKLNFTSKKTMMLAQKLYEGITLKDETVGLITYMRTDSIRLSDEFVKSTYGIRPTSINRRPDDVREYLTSDEFKLYKLIYNRALASLMKDAVMEVTSIILDNNDYKFKVTGSIVKFDGYLKVYDDNEDDGELLPDFGKYNGSVVSEEINYSAQTNKPPARYTES